MKRVLMLVGAVILKIRRRNCTASAQALGSPSISGQPMDRVCEYVPALVAMPVQRPPGFGTGSCRRASAEAR
jgi:hypothetical protein